MSNEHEAQNIDRLQFEAMLSEFIANQQSIPPEIGKIVRARFWDLIQETKASVKEPAQPANTPEKEFLVQFIKDNPGLFDGVPLYAEDPILKAMKEYSAADNLALRELVSAQEGYIQFLGYHVNSQSSFLAAHNQFASELDIQRGELFRESIMKAKAALINKA